MAVPLHVINLDRRPALALPAHAHTPGQCNVEINEIAAACDVRAAIYAIHAETHEAYQEVGERLPTDELIDSLNGSADAEVRLNSAVRSYVRCAEQVP
ncbi:MAG: hypothetical protein OXD40_00485 [bacterium]|nr:hypothetical protein [bacterium]